MDIRINSKKIETPVTVESISINNIYLAGIQIRKGMKIVVDAKEFSKWHLKNKFKLIESVEQVEKKTGKKK